MGGAPVRQVDRPSANSPFPVRAVIDIGSNSIRLVAFRADRRTPMTLFNEKVMAALGTGVAETGQMRRANMDQGIAALRRFARLCEDMQVTDIKTFATAAVRLSTNGGEFVAAAKEICGLEVQTIDGEAEGCFSAKGVLAGIPHAEGVVGDLGGGSLELVRIREGVPTKVVSLPIGSLKLAEVRKDGSEKLRRFIKSELRKVDWAGEGKGLPFYMVGGSWRALAQLQMHLSDHPLPIAHQFEMSPKVVDRLARGVPNLSEKRIAGVRQVSSQRVPHLPGAAILLRAVMKRLGSSHAVVSAYGIREGVFFDGLPKEVAERDPLLAATREEGQRHARFPHHAGALMRWIDPLFEREDDADRRLRRAACELSDVAWRAHPDFRAERSLDIALHGNWVAIDGNGRARLGAALFALNGGRVTDAARRSLAQLATFEELDRAASWGLALRLGQRLTGGTTAPLGGSAIRRKDNLLTLQLSPDYAALRSEAVEKRLAQLATHLGCECRIEIGDFAT